MLSLARMAIVALWQELPPLSSRLCGEGQTAELNSRNITSYGSTLSASGPLIYKVRASGGYRLQS